MKPQLYKDIIYDMYACTYFALMMHLGHESSLNEIVDARELFFEARSVFSFLTNSDQLLVFRFPAHKVYISVQLKCKIEFNALNGCVW